MIDTDTTADPTEEYLGDGIWKVEQGNARLFYGRCDEGCSWMLSPDYRSMRFVAQHGANPEHVLPFDRAEPFDAAALLAELDAWLARCHAYEGAS